MTSTFLRRAALLVGVTALTLTALGVPPAQATTYWSVNSNADTDDGSCDYAPGDCTLREAINASNLTTDGFLHSIDFELPDGLTTITPGSPLPALTYNSAEIDGLTQPGATKNHPVVEIDGTSAGADADGLWLTDGAIGSEVTGLVIHGFDGHQVLDQAFFSTIAYNYLGVDASGAAAVGDSERSTLQIEAPSRPSGQHLQVGVYENVVASTGSGPAIGIDDVSEVQVNQNNIGVSRSGAPLGSTGSGIVVTGAHATENYLQANAIDSNGGLALDLGDDGVTANDSDDSDTGPDGTQNYPELDAAAPATIRTASGAADRTEVGGTVLSNPSTDLTLDFYASPQCDASGHGEGRQFLGALDVTTDARGEARFAALVDPAAVGAQVTATATSFSRTRPSTGPPVGTSEYSACRQVASAAPRGVVAAAGDAQAAVGWLAARARGASPVDHYVITSSPDAATTPLSVGPSATSATVGGLQNGTAYRFEVTAHHEDGTDSTAFYPSSPVSPMAGADAPEVAVADVRPGETLTTGAGASAADPTNTTLASPVGGLATIGEGVSAMGTAPDGGPFYGQQVDIGVPDTGPDQPSTLSFVLDCSALPPSLTTCSGSRLDRPAHDRGSSRTVTVKVKKRSYSPRDVTVAQAGTVRWDFTGRRKHSVTESVGLGGQEKQRPLFDSHARGRGKSFTRTFDDAGTFEYGSTVSGDPTSMTGTVAVPLILTPADPGPGQVVNVRWSKAGGLGYGRGMDVEYRHRSSPSSPWSDWTIWREDAQRTNLDLGNDLAGAGDYELRARYENTLTGVFSAWSPVAEVTLDDSPHLPNLDVWHQRDAADPDAAVTAVPDCEGYEPIADPAPACVRSEEIGADGDVRVVVYTTEGGRWWFG